MCPTRFSDFQRGLLAGRTERIAQLRRRITSQLQLRVAIRVAAGSGFNSSGRHTASLCIFALDPAPESISALQQKQQMRVSLRGVEVTDCTVFALLCSAMLKMQANLFSEPPDIRLSLTQSVACGETTETKKEHDSGAPQSHCQRPYRCHCMQRPSRDRLALWPCQQNSGPTEVLLLICANRVR